MTKERERDGEDYDKQWEDGLIARGTKGEKL